MSTGDSTPQTPGQISLSRKSLLTSVLIQIVRDVAQGSEAERNDVIRWLANIKDVEAIALPLGFNPDDLRLRIAELFRLSPALTVHYAKRLIDEIKNEARG